MHWDGIIDCNGTVEMRAGIRVINADSQEDAIEYARKFFENGAFIVYDALLENGKFVAEIEKD
jgi:hypothetical protein